MVCSSQWDTGMAGRTSLRYGDCIAVLTLYADRIGIADVADVMPDLQTIEHALIGAWDEQREQQRASSGGR